MRRVPTIVQRNRAKNVRHYLTGENPAQRTQRLLPPGVTKNSLHYGYLILKPNIKRMRLVVAGEAVPQDKAAGS